MRERAKAEKGEPWTELQMQGANMRQTVAIRDARAQISGTPIGSPCQKSIHPFLRHEAPPSFF